MAEANVPESVFSGYWGKCHCQGIAVDRANRAIYYSFTTKLIKTDFSGNLIGSVDGLIGHLGCIDFCEADGKVYGSLEFKNDQIGRGILKALGKDAAVEDAFYCAIFDGDAVTRPDMDAEKDGVMRAVYLPDVTEAYKAEAHADGRAYAHRYGCSGIDGTGWGRAPGEEKDVLLIAAGIYGDIARGDNDFQLLFRYDHALSWWDTIARPLDQTAMHRSGARAQHTLFLYTGNTTWGVQNLEYDAFTGDWYLAVYPGEKPRFPNYSMFVLDGARRAEPAVHPATGEPIERVFLKQTGAGENGVWGNRFPFGSTGMYAFGDGRWYFSQDGNDPLRGHYTELRLYRAACGEDAPFVPAE